VAQVLVVDDDETVASVVVSYLERAGHTTVHVADGFAALDALADARPDLVVLDLMLPGIDGLEVCRRLRADGHTFPVLVLTARADEVDTVVGLDAGADDYVTKPFSIDELLARIRAVTRRKIPMENTRQLRIGRWAVDLVDRAVHDPDAPEVAVRLTKTEWQLLEALARNPGKLISQRQLLQDVWGPTYQDETQYLRQYMAQLRRKLEDDPSRPRHLITEPGMGYRFRP
jgi:two-component system, OmpR family, KDP operon response regulator KdpE